MSTDDFLREVEARSDAYLLGWHAGYDAGERAAEQDMAEAWWAAVRRIRALANPHDPWHIRVAAAEQHARRLAERLWLSRTAWESAAAQSVTHDARRAGITGMSADDLAAACGVRLPRP